MKQGLIRAGGCRDSEPRGRLGGIEGRIPGGSLYKPKADLSKPGWWILAPADSRPEIVRSGEPET